MISLFGNFIIEFKKSGPAKKFRSPGDRINISPMFVWINLL